MSGPGGTRGLLIVDVKRLIAEFALSCAAVLAGVAIAFVPAALSSWDWRVTYPSLAIGPIAFLIVFLRFKTEKIGSALVKAIGAETGWVSFLLARLTVPSFYMALLRFGVFGPVIYVAAGALVAAMWVGAGLAVASFVRYAFGARRRTWGGG